MLLCSIKTLQTLYVVKHASFEICWCCKECNCLCSCVTIYSLAFSADSSYLACSSNTDTVHVFHLQTEYDFHTFCLIVLCCFCTVVISVNLNGAVFYIAIVSASIKWHCCNSVMVPLLRCYYIFGLPSGRTSSVLKTLLLWRFSWKTCETFRGPSITCVDHRKLTKKKPRQES